MKYVIQDSTLTGLGNAIRSKTGGQNLLTTSQMITAINNLETFGTQYGFFNSTLNITNMVSGSMTNNALVNYSTTASNRQFYFFLKKPIYVINGDIIKLIFNNVTKTNAGWSNTSMFTIPYGIIPLNENYSFSPSNGKVTITRTEGTYESYSIYAVSFGPRHTTAWDNVNATIQMFINDEQLF